MKLATLNYLPNKFQTVGPPELCFELQLITDSDKPDALKYQAMLKLFSGYYVICGISGEKIPLDMLSYWNLDQQIPFKGPEQAVENAKKNGGYK